MIKKQTSQDNIFYYQETSQDILNLSLRFSYQEIGFYLTLKSAYIFHKGKIPFDKVCQFCRVFSEQESFQKFIKNNFEIVDGLLSCKSFDSEIDFIVSKSEEKKKAAKSRWENANAYPNAYPNGDAKQETRNKKHKTINNKPKFIIPTIEQVTEYCKERNNSVNPNKWMNHYISKGWKIGKETMKDWKAAVRTWEEDKPIVNKQLNSSDESFLALKLQEINFLVGNVVEAIEIDKNAWKAIFVTNNEEKIKGLDQETKNKIKNIFAEMKISNFEFKKPR